MKITCQSCQSKYNVADEKVQGKTVKIRCRKCGNTIVVHGGQGAAANGTVTSIAPMSRVAEGGSSAEKLEASADAQPWHVNVAENDQRTMSVSEILDAYNSGTVTPDTFIWTEGMDDWKPLGEVDAIVAALHAGTGAPAAAKANGAGHEAHEPAAAAPSVAPLQPSLDDEPEGADPTRVYDGRPVVASRGTAAARGGQSGGAGAQAALAAAARPEAKRAAVKRETRSRDLFASKVSPDELHGATDVNTGSPLLQMSGGGAVLDDASGKRPGERNENSVLFSLAVLTKSAETRAPSDQASTPEDDSGLIDLQALAAKTESMRPAAAVADAAVFAPPLGAIAPLGAPIGIVSSPLGDAQPKSRMPLLIGGGALVALMLVAGIFIGVKLAGSGAVAPGAAAAPSASTAPVDTASAAPAESASATAASATASATAAPTAAPAPRPRSYGGAPHGGAKPAGGAAAAGGGEAPAAAPPAKKPGGDCGCNGDLMCLMKCSTH